MRKTSMILNTVKLIPIHAISLGKKNVWSKTYVTTMFIKSWTVTKFRMDGRSLDVFTMEALGLEYREAISLWKIKTIFPSDYRLLCPNARPSSMMSAYCLAELTFQSKVSPREIVIVENAQGFSKKTPFYQKSKIFLIYLVMLKKG